MSGKALLPKQRFYFVDALRAIAIILMILCHTGIYLTSQEKYPAFYFFVNHVIGDFPAPIFLFLVGFSQSLSKGEGNYLKGFLLMFLSCVLSFLDAGINYIFEWDVLSIIGFSIISISFLRTFRPAVLIFLSCFFVFFSFALRDNHELILRYGNFEWNPFLHAKGMNVLVDPIEEYSPIFSVKSIMNGFLWAGTFPVFPCLAYPLAGFAMGKIFSKHGSQTLKPLLLLSGAFVILSAFMVFFSNVDDVMHVSKYLLSAYSFYPLSCSMMLLQFGVIFILFAFAFKLFQKKKKQQGYHRFSMISRLSRYSLTIYVLHYLMIFWPTRVLGLLHGDSEKYISNALNPEMAFATGILMIFFFSGLTKFWDGYQGKYSVEWGLSKIRKKTSVSGSSDKVQSLSPDPSQF